MEKETHTHTLREIERVLIIIHVIVHGRFVADLTYATTVTATLA